MKKEQLEITLADALPKDAKALLDFYKEVGAETDYLAFGAEGLGINQEQETRYIKSLEDAPNNRLLIARLGDDIIGVASVGAAQHAKIAHIGEVGISILRRFWGLGLSKVMMEDIIDWAIENEVLRYLRLEVSNDNMRAITLYEKYRFEKIGKTPNGMYHDGQFHDLVLMGLNVENAEQAE
ncbi:GNAT family N-acetyltransferase [Aerococcus sp. 1KP-2016]|uniref:GNAT family N-acetyltransferase n=1 Tax=Aerococcus sp. 1KP-2016 TaxID=1981982 RepID=UPI000B9836EF|nr:GNAT family protein [Aerococcus sp. 1KP-2016]OYQ66928.1 GNAT family N-acetyltransferase [Aerococcus sp. 1KP-2016]